jgi:hypothetical protein
MSKVEARRPATGLLAIVGVFAAIVQFLVFRRFLGFQSGLPQWAGLCIGIVGVSGALVWIAAWLSVPSAESPRKWTAIVNPGCVTLCGGLTVLFATFGLNVLLLISTAAIFVCWGLAFAIRPGRKPAGRQQ